MKNGVPLARGGESWCEFNQIPLACSPRKRGFFICTILHITYIIEKERGKKMIYDFSVYDKDDLLADVHMDTDRNESSIKRYVLDARQPFMAPREDIPYIYDFLESRCFENSRPDLPKILAAHGMTENNPYEWCRKGHGVMYNDYLWLKFPGESLTWKDVKVRD